MADHDISKHIEELRKYRNLLIKIRGEHNTDHNRSMGQNIECDGFCAWEECVCWGDIDEHSD